MSSYFTIYDKFSFYMHRYFRKFIHKGEALVSLIDFKSQMTQNQCQLVIDYA